jgi:hypothetical protein
VVVVVVVVVVVAAVSRLARPCADDPPLHPATSMAVPMTAMTVTAAQPRRTCARRDAATTLDLTDATRCQC